MANELDQLWEQGTEADESWQPVVAPPADTGFDEEGFQTWYKDHATRLGLNPDPDDPRHHYDYRAAYSAGVEPQLADDGRYHWPSEFKSDDHPNRYVDGVDTKTGRPAPAGARAMAVPDDIWDQGVDATDQWQPAVEAQVPAAGAMPPADTGAAELEQMGTVGKLWEAGKVAGSQAYTLAADIVPGTIYRGIRGGDEELAESWIDRQISTNEAERERRRVLTPKEREVTAFRIPFTDIEVKFGDFEDIADNLGYSIGNAIAMFGAKAATKATLGMVPVVGQIGSAIVAPMAGAAAGIAFSARVTKDQFVDDLRTQWMKAHEGELMTPDLEQEWRDFYQSVAGDATIYGLWEAVPETASNMIGWGIMKMGKGKAAQAATAAIRKKLSNNVGKTVAKWLGVPVAKLGAMWSEELLTEMITTKKQSEIEFDHGLREKPLDWMESLKAVAPAVLLSTPLMAAGFKGAQKIAEGTAQFLVKPKSEVDTGTATPDTGGGSAPPKTAITPGDIQSNPIFQRIAADYQAGKITDEDIQVMRNDYEPDHPVHQELGKLLGEKPVETTKVAPIKLDETNQKHQDVIDAALAKEYPDRDFTVQVVPQPEQKDLQAVKNVGEALGVEVVVFRGEGKADAFNGTYVDGTVYINENAVGDPYIATLGHESWHRIRDKHKDLHDRFVQMVKDEDLGDFTSYLEDLNSGRRNAGLSEFSADDALARHEFMADFVGNQFKQPEFWNALAKKDPDIGKRLAKIVHEIVEAIRNALRMQKDIPAKAFTQINAIQDALAGVYQEYSRRETQVEDQTAKPVEPVKVELTPEQQAEAARKRAAEMPLVVEFNHIAKGLKAEDRQAAAPAIFDEERPIKDRLTELKKFILERRKQKAPSPPTISAEGSGKIEPAKPAKVSTAGKNIRTFRGAVLFHGGIKWGDQFKAERKDMPHAAKMLTRQKTGIPWDTMQALLRDDNWLDADEPLLDALMDENRLKMDRVTVDFMEKDKSKLSPDEKKLRKEMEREAEDPPPGDYVVMEAEDLPKGKEVVILEDESTDGWDVYKVVKKTATEITLRDGVTITLKPGEKVQVRKQDLGKGQQQKFDYSSAQVDLPEDLAEFFVDYAGEIPEEEVYTDPEDGIPGREDAPHITIRYGMDTIDPADLAPALEGAGPIHATLGKVSIFETDKYDVIKVDVESPDLHSANKAVGDAVELPGETFKDYQPHITIAYVKKGEGAKYVGDTYFEGAEVVFDQATFSSKDGTMHPIPLTEGIAASVKREGAGKLELKGEKVLAKSVAMLKSKKRTMPKAKQGTLTTLFEEAADKAHGPGLRLEGEKASKKEAERFKEVAGAKPAGKPKQGTLFSVKTPEFKKWFGKSMVVNKDGRPRMVYHGSPRSGFQIFDTSMNEGTYGIHFSDNIPWAASYAGSRDLAPLFSPEEVFESENAQDATGIEVEFDEEAGKYTVVSQYEDYENLTREEAIELIGQELEQSPPGERGIYEVYLKVEDPLEIDWQNNNWDESPTEIAWDILDEDGDVYETVFEESERDRALKEHPGYTAEMDASPIYFNGINQAVQEAREAGYDGLIVHNIYDPGSYGYGTEGGTEYVVFKANQVKSAYNEGAFSSDNDNILFSVKPDHPAHETAAKFNEASPGHNLKFDGEWDRSAIDLPPMYQFTPQSGPSQGRTFTAETLDLDDIKRKFKKIAPSGIVFSVKKDSPGHAIAEAFNAANPGIDVKFDGEWDRSALDMGPMYQFTAYAGVAKGATFVSETPSLEDVEAKYSMIASGFIAQADKNGVTQFSLKRYSDLDKKEIKALRTTLDSMPKGDSAWKRIQRLKDTNWAKAAILAALTRHAMLELAKGKPVGYKNTLNAMGAKTLRETITKMGEDGIWNYYTGKGFISHPEKPGHSVAGSFLNCSPSKKCADVCYTAGGRGVMSPVINWAEATNWMVETDPIRAAKLAADGYRRVTDYGVHKALRFFDRGEAGPIGWVEFTNEVNRLGVRAQVFSKRPDFLRKISDKNLKLLSVDDSNLALGRNNPDLDVAFIYTGREDLEALEDFKDHMGVILPVVIGKYRLSKDEVKLLPKWAQDYLCPVDAGSVNVNNWKCTKCDVDTGLPGCFFGRATEQVMRKISTPLTERNIDLYVANLRKYAKELPNELQKSFNEELDSFISQIQSGVDPGETAGDLGEVQEASIGEPKITDSDTELEEPQFSVKFQQMELPFGQAGKKKKPAKKKASPLKGTSVEAHMQTTGDISYSGNVVKNADDAAALMAHIRKSAQEFAYTVATDKDGVVLEIHKYTKGTGGASQIMPREISGRLLNLKGVKKAYFVHNHPGGTTNFSADDMGIIPIMNSIAKIGGIKISNVVIADTSYHELETGIRDNIRPTLRTMKLPVKERYLRRKAGWRNLPIVNSSVTFKDYMQKVHGNQDGFLFVNSQLKPVGFLPFKFKRTKTAAKAVIAASEKLNASGMIFNSTIPILGPSDRHVFLKNLSMGMRQAGLSLFDVVDQGRSLADHVELAAYQTLTQPPNQYLAALATNRPIYSVKRDTRIAMGSAPGTDIARRKISNLSAGHIQSIQRTMPLVKQAFKDAGLSDDVIGQIDLDLKPIVDLRGKNVQKSLDEWTKEGKTVGQILGATTFNRYRALMQLSLEQDVDSMERTAYHESFHVLAQWVLPPKDYVTLLNHYKTEEGAAEAYSDYVKNRGPQPKAGVIQEILLKLRRILERTANALRGKGFTRPEDIFGKAMVGTYIPHYGRGRGGATTTALSAREKAPVFYSQMARTLEKLPNSGTPQSFLEAINGFAKKGAFKEEELKWSGVREWLDNREGKKITKQQVLDYLAKNSLQIKEVVKRGVGIENAEKIMDELDSRGYVTHTGWDLALNTDIPDMINPLDDPKMYVGLPLTHRDFGILENYPEDDQELITELSDIVAESATSNVRHEEHRLSGESEKYRELLLTLPEKDPSITIKGTEKQDYHSSHFDEPNILAHVRFDERIDKAGNRVLYLDEIQSDWHQAGREKGYKSDREIDTEKSRDRLVKALLNERNMGVPFVDALTMVMDKEDFAQRIEISPETERIANEYRNLYLERRANELGVPDAPLKQSRDWAMLAMKRMVRWAADHGLDAVAWSTGDIQNERWNLSKMIRRLKVTVGKDGGYRLEMVDHENYTHYKIVEEDKTLSQYIGKDLTELVESRMRERGFKPGDGQAVTVEGADFEYGGEAMRDFYDTIIVNAVNRFFGKKAWGSPKVTTTEFDVTTNLNAPREYVGPELTIEQLEQISRERYLPAMIHMQLNGIIGEMRAGTPFQDAMNQTSIATAMEVGGQLIRHPVTQKIWFLPVTDQMRDRSQREGLPLFSVKPDPGQRFAGTFYSQLEQTLEKKLPNSNTPAGYIKAIKGMESKGDFKSEELEWSGIEDWMAGQQGKVTKADILDYMMFNQVRVSEVLKSTNSFSQTVEEEAREDLFENFDWDEWLYESNLEEIGKAWDDDPDHKVWGHLPYNSREEYEKAYDVAAEDAYEHFKDDVLDADWQDIYTSEQRREFEQDIESDHLADHIANIAERREDERGEDETKHSDYQLPGGKNYRELLMTLPGLGYKSGHWDEAKRLSSRALQRAHRR